MNVIAKKFPLKICAVDRAHEKWNGAPPDWVVVLAVECDRTSQRKCAARIGLSETVINRTISNSYNASLKSVEETVRGVLLAKEVECPVLGLIRADRCIAQQSMPNSFANPLRPQLFKACRSGCPNSRLGGAK